MVATRSLVPDDTYDHLEVDPQGNQALYWHNRMMMDVSDRLWDGLARLVAQEAPDLLILLGDLVNTNWEVNVAAVAERVSALPCPVRLVTGNHDIYLGEPACRLQDAITPGAFDTGLRHEIIEGLGLLYLDLWVRDANGDHRKWLNPTADEWVDYRPADITAALDLIRNAADVPWLALGHFPMVSPNPRIYDNGRKIGRQWPGGAPLAALLQEPNNLLGIICGHQHFAHLQRFAHGFHWTLPSLVEYPCAATVVSWDGDGLQGRTVVIDEALAAASLQTYQTGWTQGAPQDRRLELDHLHNSGMK